MHGSQEACLIFSPIKLKQARTESGLTQSGLAEAVGGSYRTVQDWESGKTAPRGETLQALSMALGKPPDWFFAASAPDSVGFVPARVEFYRNRAGITQDSLALLLGHPKRVIKSWEAGTLVPNSGQKDMLETWIESVIEEKGGPTFEEWQAGGRQRLVNPSATITLESIPFEQRPENADATTLARSRFGPKTDYVIMNEAFERLDKAQKKMADAQKLMAQAQAEFAEAQERVAEILMRANQKLGD
ncbi:MAG: XRE family transcriptional regulator [Hyphomicrobiaceae bacterium]|nr:MAG: XRE family transcriptional regulator [Hyphomicrobiaceae bacterium]